MMIRAKRKNATLLYLSEGMLRNAKSIVGELGEIILYSLLEAYLKAPKLLTIELKTDYVR